MRMLLVVGAAFAAATGCSLIVSSDDDEVPGPGDGCTEHDSCDSGVCERATGACVPEPEIIYLDGSRGVPRPCGSRDQPCADWVHAYDLLDSTRRTILYQNGEFADLSLDAQAIGALPVLVVGRDATLYGTPSNHALSVWNGIAVRAEGVVLRDAGYTAAGAYCHLGSSLRLVSVDIHSNVDYGVLAEDCSKLTVESSTIRLNGGTAVHVVDSPFEIVNTVIVHNGRPSLTAAAVELAVGAGIAGRFEFNTVAENQSGATPWGVDCHDGIGVEASNNIVVSTGQTGAAVAGACEWAYSDIQVDDGADAHPGVGNFAADPMFIDPDGDFHLREGSPCIDAADRDASLALDFEDDPRNSPADVGADEYR